MEPLIIVFFQNHVYVTSDPAAAKAIGGVAVRVSGLPKTPKSLTSIVTISGAASPYTFTAGTGIATGVYPTHENL